MPFMTQRWEDLTFLHWNWPIDEIKKSLPSDLELDLINNEGWLTVAAFKLKNLRITPCRFIRWNEFYEINLRTYVKDRNGGSGVWFYSLDSSDLTATLGARMLYGLPYNKAKIMRTENKDGVKYTSTRATVFGGTNAKIQRPHIDPLQVEADDQITRFLLERYCFWSKAGWARHPKPSFVEHRPYKGKILNECKYTGQLFKSQGFCEPTRGPVISHFDSGFDVSATAPPWLTGITGQANQRLVV
jgi:uncharacterized protein YqjF (DUF2071 family)